MAPHKPFSAILLSVSLCLTALAGTKSQLTAPLDDTLWESSQWISAADAPVVTGRIEGGNERAADGASWFLSAIKNPAEVASARWMTTGLGVYSLYINGKPIGEEILKPGFTHHAKTKLSYTYDITDAISRKAGAENVFSAQSTPGWWADKIITPGGHQGMIGRKPAFRGVIELTFADGSRKVYGTDTIAWKAGMNSFNHYAYGCVGEWLWETAAGIASEPSDPRFKTNVMRPVPDRRLGSLDAVYRSPQGVIESHWKYDGDDWAWTFTVPEGSQAKVTLPGQTQETVYAPGTHSVKLSLPE